MTDLVLAGVILFIVCLSIAKIIREKRKGVKCIGCPFAGCSKNTCSCDSLVQLK